MYQLVTMEKLACLPKRLATGAGRPGAFRYPVLSWLGYFIFQVGGTIDLGNSWSSALGDLIPASQAHRPVDILPQCPAEGFKRPQMLPALRPLPWSRAKVLRGATTT
jgi:hypothetical protein